MIKRAVFVIWMHLLSLFNMFRSNLANELTLALCSGTVLVLFFHIFHNFISKHLNEVSILASYYVGNFFALFTVFAVSIFLGKRISFFFHSPKNTFSFLKSMGEEPRVLRVFQVVYLPFLILVIFVPFWSLVTYFFVAWFFWEKVLYFILCALLCSISSVSYRFKFNREENQKNLFELKRRSIQKALYDWRVKQILLRNKTSLFLIGSSFSLMFFLGFCHYLGVQDFFVFLLCFLSGLLTGTAICVQISEDFRSIWLERNAGISHHSYMKAVFQLCTALALLLILTVSFFYISSLFALNQSFDLISLLFLIKLCLLSCVPILLVNCIALQIDPRRPLVQSLVLLLISLFFCTALLINLAFLILFPFLFSYAKTSQNNRFYTI